MGKGTGFMKRRWGFLPFLCLLNIGLFVNGSLYARETLDDGVIGLSKEEVHAKYGTPSFLYCEEEPYRRYEIVPLENEGRLRGTFLYDVIVDDLYKVKRNNSECEIRFYYGQEVVDGKKVFFVKDYTVEFLNGPVPLGKLADVVPEFKPALTFNKVFQEKILNYDRIRLIFVSDKVNDLTKKLGSLYTDPDKDIKDWALSYDIRLIDGEQQNVSANSMVYEVGVSVDGEYRIGKCAHAFGTKLIKNPLK